MLNRASKSEREKIQTQVTDMLANEIIEPSRSP
jgi:hypothetical protein